jgi:hypothetical protein
MLNLIMRQKPVSRPQSTLLALALLALLAACTQRTPFGADLLEDQQADYDFTDTLTLRCTVLREDSVETSDRTSTASYFLCGTLDDPFFGDFSSDIYTLFQPGIPASLNPSILRLDSMVMYLRYTPSGVYGDTSIRQTLRVLRLDAGSALDPTGRYYSNSSLPANIEVGRAENFLASPTDNDSLFLPTSRAAFVRVRLDNSFAQELMAYDSATVVNDSAFFAQLRGLKIVSSASTAPGSMLAFNLNDEGFSRIRLYYTQDTVAKTFDYFFRGCNKFTGFRHDYNGTAAGQSIGQEANDLMYMQGAQGLKIKVEVPYADLLDNIAINRADLVLTAATLPGDFADLTPARQFVLLESVADTSFDFISDVYNSLNALSGSLTDFGGTPVKQSINSSTVTRYHHNISDQLQEMADRAGNDLSKKTMYLSVNPQARLGMRSILYGPRSTTFPAKIALTFTRTQ